MNSKTIITIGREKGAVVTISASSWPSGWVLNAMTTKSCMKLRNRVVLQKNLLRSLRKKGPVDFYIPWQWEVLRYLITNRYINNYILPKLRS